MEKEKEIKKLISTLSKHVLAHNFEDAKKLIDYEVPFSREIMSRILDRDDIISFNFLIKNNISISTSNIYDIFTMNRSNADKFKAMIIAQKFKSDEFSKMFLNKEEYIDNLKISMNYYMNNIDQVIALKEKEEKFSTLFFDLVNPLQKILSVKEFITNFEVNILGFYELKEFLPKLSIEEDLLLLEWKNLLQEAKNIYTEHLLSRFEFAKTLEPIIEERDVLNNKILGVIKEIQLLIPETSNPSIKKKYILKIN